MRAAPARLAAVVALSITLATAGADDPARAAAKTFGAALLTGNAQGLRPVLPEHGRVHLSLMRLGPEEGNFGARQVEAVFLDFFARGKVVAFEVKRCEGDGRRSALTRATATITDRDGRSGRIGLHLGFESEGERWVLREVKETAE